MLWSISDPFKPLIRSDNPWYPSVRRRIKFLRKKGLGFLIDLEKNRIVSEHEQEYLPVETLELPACGKVVHLCKFGIVMVFRTLGKNHEPRHYAQYDPRKKSG